MYAPAIGRASPTERIVLAGREVFLGRRRGLLAMLPFVGPAVIASIAYMEPRNFATISRLARNIVTNFWGSRSAPISMQCHECRRVSVARGIELKDARMDRRRPGDRKARSFHPGKVHVVQTQPFQSIRLLLHGKSRCTTRSATGTVIAVSPCATSRRSRN